MGRLKEIICGTIISVKSNFFDQINLVITHPAIPGEMTSMYIYVYIMYIDGIHPRVPGERYPGVCIW